LCTGVIGGMLAAIAVQIYLVGVNIELATAWHDLFVAPTGRSVSALAWWRVAGTALIVGYIAAAATAAAGPFEDGSVDYRRSPFLSRMASV
jgi:hypothetical protein